MIGHDCTIVNDELDHVMKIDSRIWIYDGNEDFMSDFDANFCPKCGKSLKDKQNLLENK